MEMKADSNQKTHQQNERTVDQSASAGSKGLSVTPPAYRMNWVDHEFGASAGRVLQTKLTINQPGDEYEQEADRIANQVMTSPAHHAPSAAPPRIQRFAERSIEKTDSVPASVDQALATSGKPLEPALQQDMEQRFGYDFSQVRVHTGVAAEQSARNVNAQAYTVGENIVFGSHQFTPGTHDGRQLIAHELTHVVQQTSGQATAKFASHYTQTTFGRSPSIQRKLELRPPGKGEASAFDRAQELVDRLNTLSPAIQYELQGQKLVYTVKDATALTHFDKVMKGFIDRAEIVPMRLITSKGYVGGSPLAADSFISGYVDLDDLLADDVYSFQSDLLHFLTERFQIKDYARRIGTNLGPLFPKAHRAGKAAEAAQLQYLFNDPSIVFVYEETKPNNTWVNAFKSKNHDYWVFQVMRKSEREVTGGEMWVKKKDGTRVSIDDFRKERALSAP